MIKHRGMDVSKVRVALAYIDKKRIMVGIPSDEITRNAEEINNAELGYIHEFGAPEANIPARPFLIPAIMKLMPYVTKQLENCGRDAIAGKIEDVSARFEVIGMKARDAVKARINSNIQPALSAVTLANRRARGVTRTNTLVDTGQMRNSVNYVVRDK